MIVWHVTTAKKLKRYKDSGGILPPVRAWDSLPAAERFSKQTGRKVILRLKSQTRRNGFPVIVGKPLYSMKSIGSQAYEVR